MEDGPLGNLATPGDLEESASHHFVAPQLCAKCIESNAVATMLKEIQFYVPHDVSHSNPTEGSGAQRD